MNNREIAVPFHATASYSSLLYYVQSGSGAQSASCSRANRDAVSEDNSAAERR